MKKYLIFIMLFIIGFTSYAIDGKRLVGTWSCTDNYAKIKNEKKLSYLVITKINDQFFVNEIDYNSKVNNAFYIGAIVDDVLLIKGQYLEFIISLNDMEDLIYLNIANGSEVPTIEYRRISQNDLTELNKITKK